MNIASVLKSEIARLSRKEIKKVVAAIKTETAKLRKDVVALRAALADVVKENRQLKAVCKKAESAAPAADAAARALMVGKSKTLAPLVKTVKRMRQKFGISQEEFAMLCGVKRVTVARWETGSGRIVFRGEGTAERVAKVMQMGKAEAKAELETLRGGTNGSTLKDGKAKAVRKSKKAGKAEKPVKVVKKAAKKVAKKPAKAAKKAGRKMKAGAGKGAVAAKPTYKRLGKVTRSRG